MAEKFKEARAKAITALKTGDYRIDVRIALEKNLLATGDVDETFVIGCLLATSGKQATCSPHHLVPKTTVWVCRPMMGVERDGAVVKQEWYIKFYAVGHVFFVSVHPSEHDKETPS